MLDHGRQAAATDAVILMRRLFEYYSAEEADTWMHSPHPQLGGAKPVEVIAEGRGGEVHAVLDRLDGDNFL